VLRLSIVIPALGDHAALESGLVSVLEHRPPASEVLVVFNSEYADPYHLRDEIRFIDAPAGAGPLECLTIGTRAAQGEIVHFLAAGLEVRPDWAEHALAPFADPAVACVAPLMIDSASPDETVLAGGWGYRPSGRATLVAAGLPAAAVEDAPLVGPTRLAGFFRPQALAPLATLAGLGVGDELALVALGLHLQAAGYYACLAAESRIGVPSSCLLASESGFRQGLHQECLFWRSAGLTGWASSLAAHAALLIGELTQAVVRPRDWARLAGRLVGMTAMLGLGRRSDLLFEPIEEPLPLDGEILKRRTDLRHAPISGRGQGLNAGRSLRSA
jgi:hypothetical protein